MANRKNVKFIPISDRGTITIPKGMREEAYLDDMVICKVVGKKIIIEPAQLNPSFIKSIEAALEDYRKNGGRTLKEIKEKYNLE